MAQAADAAAFQIVPQQHRGGDAVHVIVAEDRNGLSVGDGPLNTFDRLVHIPHQHGGDGQLPLPLQKFRRGLRRGDAPGGQHGAQKIRVAGCAQEGNVLFRGAADVPFFEFHRSVPSFSYNTPW